MIKKIFKLSALALLIFNFSRAQADSLFVSNENIYQKEDLQIANDHIIPMVYIEDMEYYDGSKSYFYTQKITHMFDLDPAVIVVDKRDLADYFIKPKLQQSKIELINERYSRYSMSFLLELWSKGGILINTEKQSRYIIIKNSQNQQHIAKKLMLKLIENAINNLSKKIRKNQLKTG